MNMRGDNLVKRRGKTKQFRGPLRGVNTYNAERMYDLSWGRGAPPIILICKDEIKGHWTYPKKGFIQWKK